MEAGFSERYLRNRHRFTEKVSQKWRPGYLKVTSETEAGLAQEYLRNGDRFS